jgi:hypothetical protein
LIGRQRDYVKKVDLPIARSLNASERPLWAG